MFIFTRNTTPCRPELTDEAAYLIRLMLADLYHWFDWEYGKQARRYRPPDGVPPLDEDPLDDPF
ncbi:hypothetical protein AWB75_05875 [Caballeronia catudaia]|uniref:Uncharacterized protein n=1 Tax=Caballeronia catudaia TaxID=1777136 RepID=A0A158CWC6_9BURK|nr:hypothetical protein [Caballeronia catudaia]SAK86351.1 hypothetical protein AWB75_05813 [Caballeronia catudaia]SAK86692.1 hypothetical protein AWB75_05875 [Caballeronia catudaia]